MKSTDLQMFYEELYSYKKPLLSDFSGYERNLVLTRIYRKGNNKKILDLGAGNGSVSQFFCLKGYKVYGLEWTSSGVEELVKMSVEATQENIENVPYDYPDDYFDEVFWGDNIEHLIFPEKVVNEIFRILKPGGRLVLSTPNHGWIVNRLYYLLFGIPRRTEGHKLPVWEWQHIRFFNKRQIKNLLYYCKFNDFRFHGAERRPFFSQLSRFFPELFGSVMIVEVSK